MRFYSFGNYYLSSLQQGLQGTHVLTEMDVKYKGKAQEKALFDWKKNHKTIVILNGGNAQSLADLHEYFKYLQKRGMPHPFAKFHEDEQSLGGALTSVGIVVPERIYALGDAIQKAKHYTGGLNALFENGFEDQPIKKWEYDLAQELKKYPLAK